MCKGRYIKTVQIEQTGNDASVQNGCAKTALSRQFKQNVTVARNNTTGDKFNSLLYSKLYFLSSNILSVSLYISAWKMRNMNKRKVLTTIKSINRTL